MSSQADNKFDVLKSSVSDESEEENFAKDAKKIDNLYLRSLSTRSLPGDIIDVDHNNGEKMTGNIIDVYQYLPPMEVPPTEHPLEFAYALWFSRRNPGKQTQSFDQNLRLIGRFASVEQFWAIYSHLARPAELHSHSDFHLFKDGIKPMWEDDANKHGGKWIVRLRKGLASRFWENLILAILGEQFTVGDEICGAVISIRYQEDIISVWNKTASEQVATAKIKETLKKILNLPSNTIMEYKTHTDSLKDNSSFRNTDVFMR